MGAIAKIVLAYDGTDFHGWQVQPGLRTVQGVVFEALAGLVDLEMPPPGAGRTDAGVHARGQVTSFALEDPQQLPRLARALSGRLPDDVAVMEASVQPSDFHARFSATGRRYAYRFLERPEPLRRRDHLLVRGAIDVAAMQRACPHLLGEHEFDSFCRTASLEPGKTRCVLRRAEIVPEGPGWVLYIDGDRFLHSMVRAIFGTLLDVGKGRRPPEALEAILKARDRRAAGPTAPPQGLCLEGVEYGPVQEGDLDA